MNLTSQGKITHTKLNVQEPHTTPIESEGMPLARNGVKKLIKNGLYGCDAVGFPGIGSAKNKSGFYVATLGAVKGGDNAEAFARFLVGTFFQTAHPTGSMVVQVVLPDIVLIVEDRSPW